MNNQDKTTFSLDDEEIVEEEVIDRDEEYDDEDYDDEEYDDEEYDDEGYDDEEYDDGYNDDYYDDRLNKVLDEIAELKRGMAPANIQPPQAIMPPQYIYQPTAPPAGSEVVMYNEISRLRDELAKNQSNLEMQKELTRLKEDMARDQRFAESQHNAEIQRLQSRIDELLKNASSPQDELPASQESSRVEGGNKSALDLDKLLSLNESVLLATRDGDARLQNEIGQLKKRLEEIPSLKELNGAVSAVKKAANNASGVNPDVINKLSEDIASLRAAIEEKAGTLPAPRPAASATAGSAPTASSDASELLRQLYDIKNVLGNSSAAAVKRTQVMYDLVCDYKKLNFDVHSQSISFKDKLTELYEFAKKLSECNEPDAIDLVDAANDLIAELSSAQLSRSVFADVAAYASEAGVANITTAMRDGAERYFGIVEKVSSAAVDEYADYLPDLAAAVNALEANKNEAKNNELVNDITAKLLEEGRDDEEIKDMLSELAVVNVGDILELPAIERPKNYKPSRSIGDENIFGKLAEIKAAVLDAAETLIAKSDEAALAHEQAKAEAEEQAQSEAQAQQAEAENEAAIKAEENSKALADVLAAVEELKAALGAQNNDDVTQALDEVRSNYLELATKLVEISEAIQNPPMVTSDGEEVRYVPTLSDEEKQHVVDDLIYIRNKMDEQGDIIVRLDELHNDIAGISDSIDISAPIADGISSMLGEINTQFDKLYEDISNILIESEANIINRMGELGGSSDAVENARLDIISDNQATRDVVAGVSDAVENARLDVIADNQTTRDAVAGLSDAVLADTQAIRDALASLSDTTLASQGDSAPINDAIEQLRADIAALLDSTAVNADAATIDRQKLLDDVSFLREQAELAISEGEQAADSDEAARSDERSDSINAYLDEISARVAQLATLADEITVVRDNVTNVTDNVNAVLDSVSALTDTVQPLAEDMAATRDAATATLDALAPISEQLNSILDRLAAAEEQIAYDEAQDDIHDDGGDIQSALSDQELNELSELKDSLNNILDTLPLFPQADDVVVARDNTYSILDTLATMPQADDVVVTRDNVAAILDAVTALSESLDAAATGAGNSAQLTDELSAVTEAVNASTEDVKYIRTKIDEDHTEAQEDLAHIMQDIEFVLDKIEEFDRTSAANKQEIIDAVSGIREEVHISSLDETMSAAGMDDETRDALVGEISEVRERLASLESATQSINDISVASLDGITAQLSDLQALLEDRIAPEAQADGENSEIDENTNDALQVIIDEISAIKEKLDVQTEYDTVEEILSLREDIKAARIVDQDEVTGELEAIKNELAAISSGNILDEIRALREDIINLPGSEDGAAAPTDGEINLVLNEIVSLRDEVFAFKDEVLNAAAEAPVAEQTDVPQAAEDITTILDELTALRVDQSALTDNIDELKDIISRRTTLGVAEADGEEQAAASSAVDELNVVLDEIINLKNDIERIEDSVGGDRLNALAEQVEDIRAAIDELRTVSAGEEQAAEIDQPESIDLTPIMEQFDTVNEQFETVNEQFEAVNAALDSLLLNKETEELNASSDGVIGETIAERFEELKTEISEIKDTLGAINVPSNDYSSEIEQLRAEVEALRAENEQLRQAESDGISEQLAELKEAMHDMMLASAPVASESGETSYAALIDEIKSLKEAVAASAPVAQTASLDEDTLQAIKDALAASQAQSAQTPYGLGDELLEIRDEIAQLRSLTTVTAESGSAAEVAAIRDEIAELRTMLAESDSIYAVAEDVTAIKADVQTLKDEPDLGVMSEILALRDEFQALREQIEEVKKIAGETDSAADSSLMTEVQSLRDQLFAISMANVNDPASGESNYESYNNIILDELASLRDQVSAVGTAADQDAITEELANIKNAIERRDAAYDELAKQVDKLNSDVENSKILDELAALRTDIANQRDADLTTLNFMSEMAHLVERQNQYLAQNPGSKITDQLESLKAEIASSDAVAEEVAKLREVMEQAGSATDNETILGELAELREELGAEKPSRENELILDAIARLHNEVTMLAERDKARNVEVTDPDLSDSLSDLKNQLNEIAGIVEPQEKPKTTPKKQASSGNRGKKSSGAQTKKRTNANGSTGGAKRGRKPKQSQPQQQQPVQTDSVSEVVAPQAVAEQPIADIDAIIAEQTENLSGGDAMSLNVAAPTTSDAMEVADKLAKQVANKLIMEQLVEQLGDGGVSEERVDEILRDILPQEFTTIAETESSDKIRRLANQLVLDKLRSRLNRNSDDE
ncbi:MAG: hypothetical protein NC548_43705 [Lachnospiraceae bacterium]|nr:hypothetical protein [Lachnospiraceae bacterium]